MNAPTDRKKFLGGSDIAAVIGVSPWATPLQIYLSKTGQTLPEKMRPDPQRERILRRGKLMEPVIIKMLQAELPLKVTKQATEDDPNYHIDPEHDFLAAQIDFEWEVTPEIVAHFAEAGYEIDAALIGTVQNAEVKSAHPFVALAKFGEEWTDEIPVEYATQAMHGLMVSNRQLAMVPVLVGSDNLIIYWVKRDADLIASIRDKEVRFWVDNVLAGVAPPPQEIADVYRMLSRDKASLREADPAVSGLIQSLRVFKDRERITKEAIEATQFEIGCFVLGADVIENPKEKDKGKHVITVDGKPALTIAYQEQQRIDADALREKHPEIAVECTTTSEFFTFTLKRNKP